MRLLPMPAGGGNRLGNAQVEPCISPVPIFTRQPALTVAMHNRVRACVRVHVVWCMTSLFFSLHGPPTTNKKKRSTFELSHRARPVPWRTVPSSEELTTTRSIIVPMGSTWL
jgi:protoheme ferro-lyase